MEGAEGRARLGEEAEDSEVEVEFEEDEGWECRPVARLAEEEEGVGAFEAV